MRGCARFALILALAVRAPLARASRPLGAHEARSGQAPIELGPRAQAPSAIPGEAKLVTFVYDPNDTYGIVCLPGAVTDIELRSNERVMALALGDSVRWQAQKKDAHLFVRPLAAGLFTSATLVTNERTYELTLRSASPGGAWYQRVSWSYPDIVAIEESRAAIALDEARQKARAKRAHAEAESGALPSVPADRLNFGYRLVGDAPFRPSQVFDDGTFTYIRFARKPQELPALFIETPNARDELAVYNFEPRDPAAPASPMIKVHRLFDMAVLKLGAEEVTITRTRVK